MSLALIWGIVRSCRTIMTRDMIKNLKIWFLKKCKILHFFASIKSGSKNHETNSLLSILTNIDFGQKFEKIRSRWNVFSFNLRYSKFLWVKYDQRYDYKPERNWQTKNAKKCKIWHFLKNHIFRFLIISLVIFDLQEHIIPQIKAKDISFAPYSFSFLAKINILWERKWWSCLVFFTRT